MAAIAILVLIPLVFIGMFPDQAWFFITICGLLSVGCFAYAIYRVYDRKRAARIGYEFNLSLHETSEDEEKDDVYEQSSFTPSWDPEMFEHQVAEIFERYGYEVRITPYVGDGGVDFRVFKNGEFGIVQVKRHTNPVGEPAIRDFFGCLKHENADIGYFITTSRFTDNAYKWAKGKRILLIDGDGLREMVNETQAWEGVMS
jgi:HJR/Mrr/RecB family endonuclease